ncbi:hypothetical protein EKO27_g7798 [Xylaria grammica]|uniref:Alpha/beta hydrolase fold-3 domain-containing protein n=1 Tax=Xylaria grammica TaxID=363999 RepID=A0A439CZ28_9PEZI|nr:hypothetical protein EKO27_g7798 [Xylaria grammica]
MARETGAVVLDADYRKGPLARRRGHTPVGRSAHSWPFGPARVSVCGFSAGENLTLAAATALRAALQGVLDIRIALVNYGLLGLAADPASKTVPRPINAHPLWALRLFNDCYVPDAAVSPCSATRATGCGPRPTLV